MKKIFRMIAVMGCVFAAFLLMGFTDLPEDHWAAGAVQTLVEEGTVSGFTDGTFRPNDPVTRAQFVKMLGYRLDGTRAEKPSDLRIRHWAYDVLMHSPLRTVDGLMLADDPATREQVAVYLYDCYGGGGEGFAPSVITSQTDYPVEVGWVYDNGIMCGDDGIHLRLSDGLTRAEAAALIVKSRSARTADFADAVSDSALARVFNSSALFDVEYDPSAVLTNGQMARAAYRLSLDRIIALWYENEADFEHPYANDIRAFEFLLGKENMTAEFADAPAMPENALAMLSYGIASKVNDWTVPFGDKGIYYTDAVLPNNALDAQLTWLYRSGIRPYGGGKLNTGKPVTHKMIAAALLQCDLLWGIQTSVTIDGENVVYNNEPMRYGEQPANAPLFQSVLASVPMWVVDAPFYSPDGEEIELTALPKLNYAFYNDLRNAFVSSFAGECDRLGGKGARNVRLTYYPQLVYDSGYGFTARVKVEAQGSAPETLFEGLVWHSDPENGNVYWVDYPFSYTFMLE